MWRTLSAVRSAGLGCSRACLTRSFSTTHAWRTHYETLGLEKTATPKEIKAAYFDLSKKHHPDLNPDDPNSQELFVKITEAYSVLGNKDLKETYDQSIAPRPTQEMVYRKHWQEPGKRPINNEWELYERVQKRKKVDQREKYIVAGLILATTLTISGIMVYVKMGLLSGKWKKDQNKMAMEEFHKNQQKYFLARASGGSGIPRSKVDK
eukprot:scpid92568/ scgid33372/ Chaperone protein DnaJ